jgi:hypothetical protein
VLKKLQKRKADYTFSNTESAVVFRGWFAKRIDVLLAFREKLMYERAATIMLFTDGTSQDTGFEITVSTKISRCSNVQQ